jgi:hypothetical protein
VSRAGEAAAPKTNGGGEAVVVGEKGEDEAANGEEGRDVTEGEGAGLFLATTTFFLVAAPRTGLTAARKNGQAWPEVMRVVAWIPYLEVVAQHRQRRKAPLAQS